jgi:hypothetical protein
MGERWHTMAMKEMMHNRAMKLGETEAGGSV